jgi:MFS family permease
MRLLLVEKKVAAKYTKFMNFEEDDVQRQNQQAEDEGNDQADEETHLLREREDEEHKIPPDQPRPIRFFPLLYCLSDPRLLVALLLAFVQAILLSSFDATVPTIATSYFGFDSLSSGLLFIALVLPYLLLGPIAGWAVDRYGTKPASVLGFGYLVPVLILLRLTAHGGTSEVVKYCALLALCGVGLAVISSPSIVEASTVVEMYEKANPNFFGGNGPYAQLYGINSMVFSSGLTLGPLMAGGLKDTIGYGDMNAVIAVLCGLTAALSFVFVGGKPRWLRRARR